ncbi:sigma-70 family RNA polymerase sigma factor [Saccharopolyspora hirsuta]|uniref:Sigma-70 family RNA polymerase sigma factor n=1 Tax=Saccharopolyspora hirsuta TaxID=1837 RepID=A0A5M7C1R1_SACHI|nr:sigma-70 family RNA polymerase sigma factor [Saccharopolyspora hirsuta]KAA5836376.1 sigma-70 family RNA polymerase sigma factor [Saccharopolyspora hirsuta]
MAETPEVSDAELVELVRSGEKGAYAQLYQRHVRAAYKTARQLSRSDTETDDLVSEAFANVLDSLTTGGGPTIAFRAYLLTTLRNLAYDRSRTARKVHLVEDVQTVAGHESVDPVEDSAVDAAERTLAAKAFARLPANWQKVLWHTEIKGRTPAEAAPLLGLRPNAVSALSYRAREGLRREYLNAHLAEVSDPRCRTVINRLGGWARNALSKRDELIVESHLRDCSRCRALANEVAEVNSGIRAIIEPLVLDEAEPPDVPRRPLSRKAQHLPPWLFLLLSALVLAIAMAFAWSNPVSPSSQHARTLSGAGTNFARN